MELLSAKIDMTPLCFLNEFLVVDAAVINTVTLWGPSPGTEALVLKR